MTDSSRRPDGDPVADRSRNPIDQSKRRQRADAVRAERERAAQGEAPGPVGEDIGSLKSATIMMVDDEPTSIAVLEVFLQEEGYEKLVSTSDASSALELFRATQPDLLLLDLMMPEVGGFEILAAIRRDGSFGRTPVVILTSSNEPETKLKALELGATDFLAKPVDPSELALRLRNTLAAQAYQNRLANYDAVSGLPNRSLLRSRLERALHRGRHQSQQCALLNIDLDRFRQINETLGTRVGDGLLKAVADRLDQCVRPTDLLGTGRRQDPHDTLARVGSDEFSLFLAGVGSVDDAERVARRILSSLAEPFRVQGHDLFLTCSIGIALFPGDGEDIETLLAHADVALAHAKKAGQNLCHFYDRSLNAESLERLKLGNELRRALERREMLLYYQPKVDLRSGRVVGAEALMRWQHPQLGFVSPARFIPLAEETGLIGGLGEWALWAACRQNKAWLDAGLPPLRISVNVSTHQLRPGNLLDSVRRALQESGLSAQHLVLELTESAIMEDPERTTQMLREMKAAGLRLSVDDFGTGYSSLSYLKRFPLDELKIDRSFVDGVPADADDASIVRAIVGLAHSLGLTLVAEGVETREQLEFLREVGCEEYQGYLFSKPLPPAEFQALVARTHRPGGAAPDARP